MARLTNLFKKCFTLFISASLAFPTGFVPVYAADNTVSFQQLGEKSLPADVLIVQNEEIEPQSIQIENQGQIANAEKYKVEQTTDEISIEVLSDNADELRGLKVKFTNIAYRHGRWLDAVLTIDDIKGIGETDSTAPKITFFKAANSLFPKFEFIQGLNISLDILEKDGTQAQENILYMYGTDEFGVIVPLSGVSQHLMYEGQSQQVYSHLANADGINGLSYIVANAHSSFQLNRFYTLTEEEYKNYIEENCSEEKSNFYCIQNIPISFFNIVLNQTVDAEHLYDSKEVTYTIQTEIPAVSSQQRMLTTADETIRFIDTFDENLENVEISVFAGEQEITEECDIQTQSNQATISTTMNPTNGRMANPIEIKVKGNIDFEKDWSQTEAIKSGTAVQNQIRLEFPDTQASFEGEVAHVGLHAQSKAKITNGTITSVVPEQGKIMTPNAVYDPGAVEGVCENVIPEGMFLTKEEADEYGGQQLMEWLLSGQASQGKYIINIYRTECGTKYYEVVFEGVGDLFTLYKYYVSPYQKDVTYNYEPNEGYEVSDIKINGVSLSPEEVENHQNSYTFSNLQGADSIIEITCEPSKFDITTTAQNATISESIEDIPYNESRTITWQADEGHHLTEVLVDGVKLSEEDMNRGEYTFNNIQSNHTVSVKAEKDTFTITTTGLNVVMDDTITNIPYGESRTVTWENIPTYDIVEVEIDGVQQENVDKHKGSVTFENIKEDHTVKVIGKKYSEIYFYNINTSAENATITESFEHIPWGEKRVVTWKANENYIVTQVWINKQLIQMEPATEGSYTFEKVEGDYTVRVVAVPYSEYYSYDIATESLHASVTESEENIPYGENRTITWQADVGHHITKVLIDGEELSQEDMAKGEYTFNNITENHTVRVEAEPDLFSITTKGDHVTVTESESNIPYGSDRTITWQADEGYSVSVIKVDGSTIPVEEDTSGQYTFENIDKDHKIEIIASLKTYDITTQATNATITESESDIPYGEERTIEWQADESYHIASVVIDGKPQTIEDNEKGSYTFEKVTDNHSIEVEAAENFKITTSVENGTITESKTDIPLGETRNISYSPNEGYTLASITVDGEEVDITKYPLEYIFENVNQHHTIHVIFSKIPELRVEKSFDKTSYKGIEDAKVTLKVTNPAEDSIATNLSFNEVFTTKLGTIDKDSVVLKKENKAISTRVLTSEEETNTTVNIMPETPLSLASGETITLQFTLDLTDVNENTEYTLKSIVNSSNIAEKITETATVTVTPSILPGMTLSFDSVKDTYYNGNKAEYVLTVLPQNKKTVENVVIAGEMDSLGLLDADSVEVLLNGEKIEDITVDMEDNSFRLLTGCNLTADDKLQVKYSVILNDVKEITDFSSNITVSADNVTEEISEEMTVQISPNIYQIKTEIINGKITESKTNLMEGSSATIAFEANEGYELSQLFVDGEEKSLEGSSGEYTFENIQSDHTIRVVCVKIEEENPDNPDPEDPDKNPDENPDDKPDNPDPDKPNNPDSDKPNNPDSEQPDNNQPATPDTPSGDNQNQPESPSQNGGNGEEMPEESQSNNVSQANENNGKSRINPATGLYKNPMLYVGIGVGAIAIVVVVVVLMKKRNRE